MKYESFELTAAELDLIKKRQKKMTKYYEVAIQSAGFGEFQCSPINGEGWADADDLLTEITSQYDHVFELTDEIVADALPGQLEDIRGRIQNEPDRVFGIVYPDNTIGYFGITAIAK